MILILYIGLLLVSFSVGVFMGAWAQARGNPAMPAVWRWRRRKMP